MLFADVSNLQHGFGFLMDIRECSLGAIEDLIYGPIQNQQGVLNDG